MVERICLPCTKDYAIIFSSTFIPLPHKNLNGWGLIPSGENLPEGGTPWIAEKLLRSAAQQVAIR
jgi:hypothetical protein